MSTKFAPPMPMTDKLYPNKQQQQHQAQQQEQQQQQQLQELQEQRKVQRQQYSRHGRKRNNHSNIIEVNSDNGPNAPPGTNKVSTNSNGATTVVHASNTDSSSNSCSQNRNNNNRSSFTRGGLQQSHHGGNSRANSSSSSTKQQQLSISAAPKQENVEIAAAAKRLAPLARQQQVSASSTSLSSPPSASRQHLKKSDNSGRARDLDSLDCVRPSGITGKLFNPTKDPLPAVSVHSASLQALDSRSSSSSVVRGPPTLSATSNRGAQQPQPQEQQQQQRRQLFDPSRLATPSSSRGSRQKSDVTTISTSSQQHPSSASSIASPGPKDKLVSLTKSIQELEKIVLAKPGRRSLDSDEEESAHGNERFANWARRADASKKLASKYLQLIQYDFKSSIKHDIDTRCWKVAIYPMIEAFRTAVKDARSGSSGDSSRSHSESDPEADYQHQQGSAQIHSAFQSFIEFAQDFYEKLKDTLRKLESRYNTADTGGGTQDDIHQPRRWHRCICILGDLARYRWLHNLNDDMHIKNANSNSQSVDWLVAARRLYRQASELNPNNGKMYNQLALLSGGKSVYPMYYYSKSLTVKASFVTARESLISYFSANENAFRTQLLSLKGSSARARRARVKSIQNVETMFLLVHAMLFEKINLEHFERNFKVLMRQLGSLHYQQDDLPLQSTTTAGTSEERGVAMRPKRWGDFYFMLAVINVAAVYEYNWSSSTIAKSHTTHGSMSTHLSGVATLPYSTRLLFSMLIHSMDRYLKSLGEDRMRRVVPWEEQEGWLLYCHVVLAWLASRPLGPEEDQSSLWILMANPMVLPQLWYRLVEFMNHHWDQLSPFEQSDMLSALSAEDTDDEFHPSTLALSTPPLPHEWELQGLAWLPPYQYSPEFFKSERQPMSESELKNDHLWKDEVVSKERMSRRLVELSLLACKGTGILEFDYLENVFRLSELFTAKFQEHEAQYQHSNSHSESTDERYSFRTNNYHDFLVEDDQVDSFTSDGGQDLSAEDNEAIISPYILELKNKRDRLKALLNVSNVRPHGNGGLLGLDPQPYQAPRYGRSSSGVSGGDKGDVSSKFNSPSSSPRQGYGSGGSQHQQLQRQAQKQLVASVVDNSTLVVDTNCIISDWTIVQKLVQADRWTVIVPLAVVTELDGLQHNPAPLGPAAQEALAYLEACLAARPRPRRLKVQTTRGNYLNDLSFRVESFDFDKKQQHHHHRDRDGSHRQDRSDEDMDDDDDDDGVDKKRNLDDFILGICLMHKDQLEQQQQQHSGTLSATSSSPSTMVGVARGDIFLVTDDRNLRVKARARSVDVLGRTEIGMLLSRSGTTPSSPSTRPVSRS